MSCLLGSLRRIKILQLFGENDVSSDHFFFVKCQRFEFEHETTLFKGL